MAFQFSNENSTDEQDDQGASEGLLAEINITPLVDVFLVLLIIFMVSSSVMSQMGVQVDLPKVSQGLSEGTPEGVVITLSTQSKVEVNGQSYHLDQSREIESKLRELLGKTKSKTLILEGDRQAYLGMALTVMDIAKKAGALGFAIATTDLESSGKQQK